MYEFWFNNATVDLAGFVGKVLVLLEELFGCGRRSVAVPIISRLALFPPASRLVVFLNRFCNSSSSLIIPNPPNERCAEPDIVKRDIVVAVITAIAEPFACRGQMQPYPGVLCLVR